MENTHQPRGLTLTHGVSKKFPYQLTEWQPTTGKLKPFIEPFVKYQETHRAVIVKHSRGFAIFTSGNLFSGQCQRSIKLLKGKK